MRKVLSIILSLVLLLSLCTVNVCATDDIKVIIDITTVKFDVPPTIVSGRTLVPLRAIFEALGATVEWDDATQTVTSEKGDTKISLTINSNIMTVNGEEKTLDVPATLIDSRTLVPVRAISESFGLEVGWDGENNIVSILSNTDTFQMLYAPGGRSRVYAKSSAATQEKHGWHEYPVTAVYSADGKETVVATDTAQSYLDSGYYAYPVKTVYKADGTAVVIASAEFDAYLTNGYFAEKPAASTETTGNKTFDYSEYGDVSEETLAILTLGNFIKKLSEPQNTTVHSVYGGYYEGAFLVVTELTAVNTNALHRYEAVVRLESGSKVTCVYDNWADQKAGDAGFDYDWAKALIPEKTKLFTGYNTKKAKDAIMDIVTK